MNYTFESLCPAPVRIYTAKNAVGFPYAESTRLLSEFDRFCLEQFPNEETLTKEICLAWAIRRDTEGNNTFRNRLMPVRSLPDTLTAVVSRRLYFTPILPRKGHGIFHTFTVKKKL